MNKPGTDSSWIDPDDAPELHDEWFAKADFKIGREIVRKGRPPGSTKKPVSLRLDEEVIEYFRKTGPGWQTRMNDVLRRAAGR